jgi:hypothetical protein
MLSGKISIQRSKIKRLLSANNRILFREFAEKRLLAFFRTRQNTKQKAGAIYKRKSVQNAVMNVMETQNSRKRQILSKANRISMSKGNSKFT